jgi:ribosome recycling factor
MASVAVTGPKTLTITPYDRSTLKAMVKALLASDIGITPMDDGSVIRLVFPPLTEEHRKTLAKQIQKMGEEARVAIRNIRRDANDDIKKQKKNGEMTEDEQKSSEKAVHELTDRYVKKIDEITAKKEKEVLQL